MNKFHKQLLIHYERVVDNYLRYLKIQCLYQLLADLKNYIRPLLM